jgi:hypothetical protein
MKGGTGHCGPAILPPPSRSLTDKLLCNPHSTLQRGSHRIIHTEQVERTQYERGEKWWGPDEHANPNLTPQKPLLDGAEGKLVDSSDKDNGSRINLLETIGGQTEMIADKSPLRLMEEVRVAPFLPSGNVEKENTGWPEEDVVEAYGTTPPGLEPPRLEVTGGPVTGADTPQHRIEN